MTWEEFALARQVLVEEYIGSLVRESKRREDHVAKQSKAHLGARR
jgi:hypothetical protein